MTSLLDLVPSTIKAHNVPILGLPLEEIVALAGRFPEIRKLIDGENVLINADLIFMRAPQAVAAIIAAGTGKLGDKKHEAAAARLPLEMQIDFIEAIIKATAPNGLRPLADRLAVMWEQPAKPEPTAAAAEPGAPAASLTPSQIRSTKSFKRAKSEKL